MAALDITLGVETSAGGGSLALLRNGALLAEQTLGEGKRLAGLVPAAQALLQGTGLTPKDLGLIVVDVGPGSFTGTRVGVAFAKAFAYASGASLAGVSSLEARAAGAAWKGARGVLAVALDARRGRLYGAAFRVEAAGMTRLVDDALFEPEALKALVPADSTWLGEEAPAAAAVARLGEAAPHVPPFALAPAYLRRVEAQEKRRP